MSLLFSLNILSRIYFKELKNWKIFIHTVNRRIFVPIGNDQWASAREY